MTFEQLVQQVMTDVWPLGPAENLVPSIRTYVVNALIEVQRAVECWQCRHVTVIAASNTVEKEGYTVITAPRGRIWRVGTAVLEAEGVQYCSSIAYVPLKMEAIREFNARRCGRKCPTEPQDAQGFAPVNAAGDALGGRAVTGYFALEAESRRLHLCPPIQSNEVVWIEWDGIKREWSATDPVPDSADFIRLIGLWVKQEYDVRWNCESANASAALYRSALADAIVTCQEERRLRGPIKSAAEVDQSWAAWATPSIPPGELQAFEFAVVGNLSPGTDRDAVAAAVANFNPAAVVAVGDLVYGADTPELALVPYQKWVDAEAFWPCLGNRENDTAGLGQALRDYLSYMTPDATYFSVVLGPCQFFVINSGLNSAGTVVEPDGIESWEIQASELDAPLLASVAVWKIGVFHHPITSSSSTYAGEPRLNWPMMAKFDLVLCGHPAQYERILLASGKTLVTAGTGGQALDDFGAAATGSQVRIKAFGALRIVADAGTLTVEFVKTDGSIGDTFTISK